MCSALTSLGRQTAKIAVLVGLVLVLTSGAFAQGLTSVQGHVTDPTGAVIPGVTVTITNSATGASRQVISDENGVYQATQLAPGTYNIKAELPGFKTQELANVPLPVDQAVTRNVQLEVGAVSDVVEVAATAETVNTENAQLGNGFEAKQILDLPLNARNIVGLLSLQNGVTINVNTGNGNDAVSGFVNGARNDQQNIVLDGVDINQQQAGTAFSGAIPTTLDSVQEFIVQTSGQNATASRSGAQVQLVTKSGSNQFHGSIYEAYRSKVTTATPYFSGQATPKPGLIRNIPGGSIGGPIFKNKLFFFGAFERHTDRSQTSVSRTVPTPTYLNGILRYQRNKAGTAAEGAYGTISQGCGGQLAAITNVSCDTVNPALFASNGFMQQYAPYVLTPGNFNGQLVCPSDCSNFENFTFNAPNIVNDNIYVSRIDYNINSKNTFFVRGTLNNSATVGSPTFPDKTNGLTTYDNSKGFAASLNSVLSPTLNNSFTAGLTRQDGNSTGLAAVSYGFGPTPTFQTTGASHTAIDTWNFTDNLSWIHGAHSMTYGVNFGFIDNNLHSFNQVSPGSFSEAANYTVGDFAGTGSITLGGALGTTEYGYINNASTVENNIIDAIGGTNLYSVGLQWDKNGNLLPVGSPFDRIIRLDQYDFYAQDSWRMKPNFTLNYGLHWGVVSPPWEKNGNEVNWTQSLGERYLQQKESPYTADQMPLLTTQLAGRANGLPDYYAPALNNFAPRLSFAYTPKFEDGILGVIAHKGGQMSIRGGYALSFDHTGGSLASNAATAGGIGLFTSDQFGQSGYSINGNGKPAIPRVSADSSGNLILPYAAFPVVATQSFTPASSAGGWGPTQGLLGIDSALRPPSNHLLNLTVSKELPGGFVLDVSYVGRFARGLFGVLDMANPVNVVDPQSGQDYYSAMGQLISQYEYAGVGSQFGAISAANAVAATANIAPIPWFEHVYGGFKNWAQTGLGPGVAFTGCPATTIGPCTSGAGGTQKPDSAAFTGINFANATQAFYATLNKGLVPGPNTAYVVTNNTEYYESDNNIHITTDPQAQYQPLYRNVGWSNFNSLQFTIKKRFTAGYTATLNYTWSKSEDVTSQGETAGSRPGGSGGQDQLLDPYHPEKNYAPSTFDRPMQVNANFLAELPIGQGKPIFGNMPGPLNKVFGGWQVSGILNVASGTPFDYHANLRYSMHYNGVDNPLPTQKFDYGINYGNNPNNNVPYVFWIKDASAQCGSTCSAPNREAAVSDFTNVYPNGAVARNYARGPGYTNLDASILKTFKFGDRMSWRLSADAFNVLNHPNFANPSGINIDQTAGTLGQITGLAGSGNRVMQFNLRVAF